MDLLEDEDIDVRKECKKLISKYLKCEMDANNIEEEEHIEIIERRFLKYISHNTEFQNKLMVQWIITDVKNSFY